MLVDLVAVGDEELPTTLAALQRVVHLRLVLLRVVDALTDAPLLLLVATGGVLSVLNACTRESHEAVRSLVIARPRGVLRLRCDRSDVARCDVPKDVVETSHVASRVQVPRCIAELIHRQRVEVRAVAERMNNALATSSRFSPETTVLRRVVDALTFRVLSLLPLRCFALRCSTTRSLLSGGALRFPLRFASLTLFVPLEPLVEPVALAVDSLRLSICCVAFTLRLSRFLVTRALDFSTLLVRPL